MMMMRIGGGGGDDDGGGGVGGGSSSVVGGLLAQRSAKMLRTDEYYSSVLDEWQRREREGEGGHDAVDDEGYVVKSSSFTFLLLRARVDISSQ